MTSHAEASPVDSTGYHIEVTGRLGPEYVPINFNKEYCCWAELEWTTNRKEDGQSISYWVAVRPA